MIDTGGAIGADLGSVFGADKEWFGGTFWALEVGEMFGDEFGMVKAS